MPNLTMSIPHQLTQAEAKQRLHDHLGMLRQHQGGLPVDFVETWTGDRMDFTLRAAGQAVKGFMIVGAHVIDVSVELPWMLSLLAGSLKRTLAGSIHKALEGPAPDRRSP